MTDTNTCHKRKRRSELFTSSRMTLHACIFGFFAGSQKKLQLAVCGSNLPTLLEFVKPHNTCWLRPRISVSFRHLQVVRLPRISTFDSHVTLLRQLRPHGKWLQATRNCVKTTPDKPKHMPDYGRNRAYDHWNANRMLCQLSHAVRSVQVCTTSKMSL